MSGEDDDVELIARYRGSSLERPDKALDEKILRAASRAKICKALLPMALSLAAILALAWVAPWHEARRPVSSHRAVRSEFVPGLYDGRMADELADPAMTQQSSFNQMPGGTEGGVNHGS